MAMMLVIMASTTIVWWRVVLTIAQKGVVGCRKTAGVVRVWGGDGLDMAVVVREVGGVGVVAAAAKRCRKRRGGYGCGKWRRG